MAGRVRIVKRAAKKGGGRGGVSPARRAAFEVLRRVEADGAFAAPQSEAAAGAGTLVVARGDDLVVACGGETTLKLLEVQPEGKQRVRARDFINGSRLQAGERLG